MRTLIIVVATAFVLLLAFGANWWFDWSGKGRSDKHQSTTQSTRGRRGGTAKSMDAGWPAPATRDTGTGASLAGPTSNPKWSTYHARTGRKVSQVSARMSRPLPDKRLYVDQPQADFFMRDGQILRVIATDGIITTQKGLKAESQLGSTSTQSPSSGELHNVTLFLFKDSKDARPLTVTMNNASFDNELFRIWTDRFIDPVTKKEVAGDLVPVVLRSDDYEFNGKGLDIRWDEADQRLMALTVAHGDRLLVKHPDRFMKPEAAGPATEPSAGRLIEGIALASADPAAGATPAPRPKGLAGKRRPASATSRPKMGRDEGPPLYRATFSQNVVITQGAGMRVTAEQMEIDFLMQPEKSDSDTEAAPDTQPSPTSEPSTAPRVRHGRHPRTQPSTTQAAATTGPAANEEPILVTWTGPLTIKPLVNELPEGLGSGQSVVTLLGQPVNAIREGSTIRCAALHYTTADGRIILESSAGQPVVMVDPKQATITTGKMDFSRQAHLATLLGKSSAIIPTEEENRPMRAEWTERCTLYFAGDDASQMALERAELHGHVAVAHPHLNLTSQQLALDFEQTAATTRPARRAASMPATGPTTGPGVLTPSGTLALRQLNATGTVHCQILDTPDKPQTIDCDHLTLLTAKDALGKSYPRTIVAAGDVHVADREQDLRAAQLLATLSPSTKPTTEPSTQPSFSQVQIESLAANDNVRVKMADGATAESEKLLIDIKEGKQHVMLTGSAQRPATLTQKQNTLASSRIEFDKDGQRLTVPAAGTLKGVQQENPQQPARPIEVSWTRGLIAEGEANQIECLGDVTMKGTDADGTSNDAAAQRVKLLLADAPATRPVAAATQPTTRSKSPAVAMGGKVVRGVILYEKAHVASVLLTPDGATVLKRTHVEGEQIEYQMRGEPGGPQSRALIIPVAGRMLIEDHRPAASQPATQTASVPATNSTDSMANSRGKTALQWEKSLNYDEGSGKAVLEGGVLIVHAEEGSPKPTYELSGDRFVALLDVPTSQPADKSADLAARVQVKRFQGESDIVFKAKGQWFEAETLDYNPVSHLLVAKGTDRKPGRRLNDLGVEQETFDELQMDVQGNLFSLKNVSHRTRP